MSNLIERPDTMPIEVEIVEVSPTFQLPLPITRALDLCEATWSRLFGCLSLVVGLALLASIPVLQLLSFGYLLEVSGRVARTGRMRDGWIGIEKGARLGSFVLSVWVLMLLPRLLASLAGDAALIDPHSNTTRNLRIATLVSIVWIVLHAVAACHQGGKLRHFLWPRPVRLLRAMCRPNFFAEMHAALWNYIVSLRLPYYFLLGLKGLVTGFLWLVLPTTLLAAGGRFPLVGLLGGVMMVYVVLRIPFLQARFSQSGNIRAMFQPTRIKQDFRRAPLAFLIALVATLSLSLPLYLLKIELVPHEAAWLPSILFIISIFPARILTGWAVARANRRETASSLPLRLGARLLMLAAAAAYVAILFSTMYLSWYGTWSLYEQHAILLPVPLMGY